MRICILKEEEFDHGEANREGEGSERGEVAARAPGHGDAQLADQAAPATVNRILSALRGVLRAAWRAGTMDSAAYQTARDVRGVRGSRLPRGRAVEPEEWRRLFKEIGQEESPVRERDAAL